MATYLVSDIHKRGIDCYVAMDRLSPGVDFRRRIIEEIQTSNEMLVILTPTYKPSPWLIYEVGIAEGAKKPIFPIISGCADGEIADMEFLRHLHAPRMENKETYFLDLEKRKNSFLLNEGARWLAEMHREIAARFGNQAGINDAPDLPFEPT